MYVLLSVVLNSRLRLSLDPAIYLLITMLFRFCRNVHNWWLMAVCQLQLGECDAQDEVLAVFDTQIWGAGLETRLLRFIREAFCLYVCPPLVNYTALHKPKKSSCRCDICYIYYQY